MSDSTTNINICMDSDLKAQADRLFGELGVRDGFPLTFPSTSPTAKRLPPCWKQKGLQKTHQ